MFDSLVAAVDGTVGAGAAGAWARVENAACARRLASTADMVEARWAADGSAEREQWCVDNWDAVAAEVAAAQNVSTGVASHQLMVAMALRERHRDAFEKQHGVRLGFMSIFVKAAIVALKELPGVNAEIDGDDVVYKNHYDIGVAVGTEQGLVVPVVRDADRLSFADIEKTISEYGRKARDGKLTIEELSGGTFTISNGGIYGSLMSTPILNPPQSGILGMHKIAQRPVAVGDKVEIRPMMYVALSYDHRIVDGREAVTFLVRVKECIENPERMLFDV